MVAGHTRRRYGLLLGVGLLALLLHLPALGVGFRGDDYVQRAMIRHTFPGPRAAWDLFRFAGPSPAENQPLLNAGYLPYWSAENLSLAMFRPLSSALLRLDHQVFGDFSAWHHLHSLLWWVLACLSVTLFLHRLLPTRAAWMGSALFYLDESSTVPVAWLANRSALVATALGALALSLQLQAGRTERPQRMLLASAITLFLALLAGEYGLSLMGYVLALALLLPGTQPRSRYFWLALPPLAYLGLRAALHHGVSGSGYYLTPWGTPAEFLTQAPIRAGALGSLLWMAVPPYWLRAGHPLRPLTLRLAEHDMELFRVLPAADVVFAVLGLASLLTVLYLAARHFRARASADALVLAVGSTLAIMASTSALPEDRLLLSAAIGQSGLLGLGLCWAIGRVQEGPGQRRWPALALGPLLLLHGGVAPAQLLQRTRDVVVHAQEERAHARHAELPDSPASTADAQVFVLGAPDFLTAANLPYVRAALGFPLLPHYQRLQGAIAPLDLLRTGLNSLQLRILVANLGGTQAGSLYRPSTQPLKVGQRLRMPGCAVQVLEVRDGNPARLQLTFDRDLDAPNLHLMMATGRALKRLHPPRISQSVRVPPAGYLPP